MGISLNEYFSLSIKQLGKVIKEQVLETSRTCKDITIEKGFATGAGDSLAVALITQYLSKLRIVSLDPISLSNVMESNTRPDTSLILISYKGRTRSVIELVKKALRLNLKTVVVTSNMNSPLAKLGRYVVHVIRVREEFPVGIKSFIAMLTSLLTVIKLLNVDIVNDLTNYVESITNINVSIEKPRNEGKINDVVIIGSGVGLGVAYYICLKIFETLCMPCRVLPFEELLHAGIFSVRNGSLIMAFMGEEDMRKYEGHVLELLMRKNIARVNVVGEEDDLKSTFKYIIAGLKIIQELIEIHAQEKPCFLYDVEALKVLTPLIYLM